MNPFIEFYIFILNFTRGRLVLGYLLGIHFLLAVMACGYLTQLPIALSDSSGGLWFVLVLAWGVPMTLIASLFYMVIIVIAIVVWQKQKRLKRVIRQSSNHRLANGLLSICLIVDLFYILVMLPQSLSAFWIILNLRV